MEAATSGVILFSWLGSAQFHPSYSVNIKRKNGTDFLLIWKDAEREVKGHGVLMFCQNVGSAGLILCGR